MSFYLTLREGPSAATSVPLLVVCDDRVIGAFLRELRRMTRASVCSTVPPSVYPASCRSPSAPPVMSDEPRTEGVTRPSGRTPSTTVRAGQVQQ